MIDFTGTWKANLAKSKLPGPSPKSLTMKIDQSQTDLRQEIAVTRPDGNEDRMILPLPRSTASKIETC